MHIKKFKKTERRGLPGGPNEMFTYVTGVFSTEGYKNNSPDKDNPFNIIPSGNISMKDVDFPVMGVDNLGNSEMMMPGGEYEFPGDMVFEMPMGKSGIEIKPENKGKFTRWAKKRGMTVKQAYTKVLANKDKYPPSIVKMANFARNAAGWKKQEGGEDEPWYKRFGKKVLNEALYKMNPLYQMDDVLQATSIPANLIRESIEGISGKGDGSFDWKNIIPDIRNTTILDETEDQTPVSEVLGVDGTTGFITDLLTDPTSYLGAGIIRGGAKTAIPKVVKSVGNVIKTKGDDVVTDMFGNTIKKSDAERLFRIEDPNVNMNTYVDPKTNIRSYESGNWMGSDQNDLLYYLNNTAKAGVPRGAGNMLDPSANRRLITGYLDKETADLFRATNPNATDVVKDFSGGPYGPKSSEFLIPPDLMDVLRSKGKTLNRQEMFEAFGDFFKKNGGDLPKAQAGFFKELIKQGAKYLDNFIPSIQRQIRNFEPKLGITSKNMVDQVDVPGTDVKIESPSNLAKFLDKIGFHKLTGRNSYLPSWAREGTGDQVVARTKMPGAYSFDNKGLRLLYDPAGGYYHIPEAFIDNPMVAGKTFKTLEDFMPKGSILKQAPEGTLSSDSYKLMMNRLKRGKFSDVTNYKTSMFLNPYGKKTFGVEGKNAFSLLDDSTFDAINSLENQMFNLQRQGKVGEGFTGFGKRFSGDTYEVGVPNLAIRKNYKKGGKVTWMFKGKEYSGTLLPEREDANNRYALTHNGKIKTLPKKQMGGKLRIYKDYVDGVYDKSPNLDYVEKVYDKLNRVYINQAKEANMSTPNYILTYLLDS